MLKKILLVSLLLCYSCSFAATWQDESSRCQAIEEEIQRLEEKQAELRLLEKKIEAQREKKHPKIALVLSGGGAKGAAHIGVLKVLEKYQVPVDMVVGTSIGSIIGGMYAVGYSADDIQKVMLNMNFDEVMGDQKDRELQGLEEKFLEKPYPLQLNMDKQMNFSVPKGFFHGQNVYFQLKDIFAPAAKIQNFDDFPRAFRAVATDLQTGKEAVFQEGDLALATFCSMAIPAFISPVPANGSFYVDGGVVNNFPVDVAIAEGADIIIAVDIAANDKPISANSSILSVIDKIASYNGNKATEFHKKLANILITPNVKEHNTVDFHNLEALIEEGMLAAEEAAPYLEELSSEKAYQDIEEEKLSTTKLFYLPKLVLEGGDHITKATVEGLDPKKKSHLYLQSDLDDWAKSLYANDYVEALQYRIEGEKIIFKLQERKEILVNFGLAYHSDYGASFHLAGNIPFLHGERSKHIGAKFEVSEYPKAELHSSFLLPIKEVKIYGKTRVFIERAPIYFYEGRKQKSNYYEDSLGTALEFGVELPWKSILQYQLSYQKKNFPYHYGEEVGDLENYDLVAHDLSLHYDSLNQRNFPSEGSLFEARIGQRNSTKGADFHYLEKAVALDHYRNIYKKLSGSVHAHYGEKTGKNLPLQEYYRLGGNRISNQNIPMMGVALASIQSKHYHLLGLGLQYQAYHNLFFLGNYNFLDSEEKNIQSYGLGVGFSVLDIPVLLNVGKRKDFSSPIWEFGFGYSF